MVLPVLGENLGHYAHQALARRGVEIFLNTRVTGMTEKEIFLARSIPIPASTLVWTAGMVPNPLVSSLPCQKECGRLLVNECLQVPGWPGVWAVGDCGLVPDIRRPGESHPPTAQHAIRQGRVVAQNIAASLYNRPLKAFSFKTIGLLASIGRRRGVARICGFNFSGFFAWWLWRTIYLSKLPGLDRKIRVAFEWTLDLLFRKDVCAVHHRPSRSDSYREEHREIAFGSNGNGRVSSERRRQPWQTDTLKKRKCPGIFCCGERSGSSRKLNLRKQSDCECRRRSAKRTTKQKSKKQNCRHAKHSNSYRSRATRRGARNSGYPSDKLPWASPEAGSHEVLCFRRNDSAVRPSQGSG